MKKKANLPIKQLIVAGAIILACWILAIVVWQSFGPIHPLFFLGYVGTSAGVGLWLYLVLPRQQQPLGRRVVLFLLGTSLFGVAALRDSVHMLFQIEGLFFDLLAGVFQAAVVHYLIARSVVRSCLAVSGAAGPVGRLPSSIYYPTSAARAAFQGSGAGCGMGISA